MCPLLPGREISAPPAGQYLLLAAAGTLDAGGFRAAFLHGKQQQAAENKDVGEDHEQFDQGETPTGVMQHDG